MSVKRVLIVVVVASALLLAEGSGPQLTGTARALPPVQAPGPTGATIPYPGRLTDEAGEPVSDGSYDFTFALYDAETGGEPLWMETQEDVAVQGGAFTALLGSVVAIPKQVLEGGARWLAVGVRGPGEGEFTALAPRQELSTAASTAPASPSAGPACPHDHLYESWVGSNASYAFRVQNTGTGDGIRGRANTTNVNYAGVYGYNSGNGGSGVYGASGSSGPGVYGSSASGWGLEAEGGGDASGYDLVGDLVLRGVRGEIFASGSYLNLYTNWNLNAALDNDNNDSNGCFRLWDGADAVVGQWCENGSKSAILQTESYGQRAVYTMESPEVWLEDLGSGSLVDGAATVAFEPIFAETVNLEMDYHVFVTPVCQEPVLLFVTAKSTSGFTVRGVTLDGQASACGFDYRVVGKRLGLEGIRLEPLAMSAGQGDGSEAR